MEVTERENIFSMENENKDALQFATQKALAEYSGFCCSP